MQGAWVWSLVGELRPHMLHSLAKKKKKPNALFLYPFPCSSVSKASACNAGDLGSIPGSGSSPGEGNGNLLHYSCLENPMNRGTWRLYSSWDARVRNDSALSFFLSSPPPCLLCLLRGLSSCILCLLVYYFLFNTIFLHLYALLESNFKYYKRISFCM